MAEPKVYKETTCSPCGKVQESTVTEFTEFKEDISWPCGCFMRVNYHGGTEKCCTEQNSET